MNECAATRLVPPFARCLGIALAMIVAFPALLAANGSADPTAAPPQVVPATAIPGFEQLGQPRADLTADQLKAFNDGKKLFTQPLPKMGPLYNEGACVDCHFMPTFGGGGDVVHAAFMGPGPDGQDVDFYRRHGLPGWKIPDRPANVSHRVPPPLYGLGLVEQIPDGTIVAACTLGHVDYAKPQGSLPPNKIARYGMKPFLGTIPDFVGAALMSESSVTTAVEGGKDDDAYPDPEVDAAFVESLAAFVRGLPPPPRNGNDPAGAAVFHAFGCAGCHVQDLPPAMGVFSDFCLHRMGDALADGIFDHEAKGDEFRTAPLWGLRFRRVYLHDGRANSLDAAIVAHDGDAHNAAAAYQKASDEQRAALIRFLQTL